MHKMCECSLAYKELVKAIENGKCNEYERLKDDDLNKHSVVHRVAGITYCYGWFCEHRKKTLLKFTKEKIKPSLDLSYREKEYIKDRSWDFLLDEDWVAKNMFEPSFVVEKGEVGFKKKSPVPLKHPSEIETGDIVIFYEYHAHNDVKSEFKEDGYRTDRFYEWDSDVHSSQSCPSACVVPKKETKEDE